MKTASILLLATIACFAPAAFSQTSTQSATQAQPWKQISIPPLHEFKPQEPKRIELKNGLVILLQEDHELPIIDGFFEIRGGSRNVEASKTGLIDLYGEVWRTSGTAKQNGDQLDDLLEAKAAKVETSGDDDSTRIGWSCLKADSDLVLGIAIDLLEHPAFNNQKLNIAKQSEAAGIVRRNDDASEIASREAERLVYGTDSPYTRQVEFSTVMPIKIADLQQWHDKTVVASNIIVGVSGDFDAAEMEKKLRAAFESLPRGTKIAAPKVEFNGPKPGVYFVDKKDVNQSNIWIAGLGTLRNNPDYYALQTMNQIFSGGFGSRLFQEVRTRLGYAYSVSGRYGAQYDHPGLFYAVAGSQSANTVKATQAVLKEIDKLKTEPFTETELKSAKDQILNSFIFRYDTKDKVLAERATLEFYGYPSDYTEKYRAGIEKVGIADVERVAKKYVDTSKLAILVVGNSTELGNSLSELGTVKPIDITIPMPAGAGPGPGQGPAGGGR
jgi:zinc protease